MQPQDKIVCVLVTSLLCLTLASCTGPAKESTFDITLQKAADSVQVTYNPRGTLFVVVSESGIGSAEITSSGGGFVGKISIRFTYADGRGFGRLEGKTVTTESGTLTEGDLPAELRNGAVEIDVPAQLFTNAKRLKVTWIDMYR